MFSGCLIGLFLNLVIVWMGDVRLGVKVLRMDKMGKKKLNVLSKIPDKIDRKTFSYLLVRVHWAEQAAVPRTGLWEKERLDWGNLGCIYAKKIESLRGGILKSWRREKRCGIEEEIGVGTRCNWQEKGVKKGNKNIKIIKKPVMGLLLETSEAVRSFHCTIWPSTTIITSTESPLAIDCSQRKNTRIEQTGISSC